MMIYMVLGVYQSDTRNEMYTFRLFNLQRQSD